MKICKEDVIARLQQIKQMYIWNSAADEALDHAMNCMNAHGDEYFSDIFEAEYEAAHPEKFGGVI